MALSEICDKFKEYAPHVGAELLEKAYRFSEAAHARQSRASGEHYFSHCEAVANTLVEFKLDLPTIAAGLLHDVLEDTPVKPEELRKEFGEEVVRLVEGVTKVDALKFASPDVAQAENWRKMLLATAQDVRVILIKLADRLHNMSTLEYLDQEHQVRISQETITLYAPLAQRLGMFQLKSELEDLAFKFLHPEVYRELDEKIRVLSANRDSALAVFKEVLEKSVEGTDIPYRFLSRSKSLYSIYQKMLRQDKPFEEIQDALGVRLVTDSVASCYGLLGIVHSTFKPVSGTFTDYISIPKINLYQSLHTTVVGPAGDLVEVQIRTEEMHRTSEYGIAAHWRYKTEGAVASAKDPHLEEKLNWLRQWIEWLQDLKSPREFLESLKTDLELHQVFVFTPRGEVKVLPGGATPLDFAYAVHTEIGQACFGSKVNGKMVKLDHELKSGDICEILTRKGITPKKDWINMVKTARARSKIKKFLREHGEEI